MRSRLLRCGTKVYTALTDASSGMAAMAARFAPRRESVAGGHQFLSYSAPTGEGPHASVEAIAHASTSAGSTQRVAPPKRRTTKAVPSTAAIATAASGIAA